MHDQDHLERLQKIVSDGLGKGFRKKHIYDVLAKRGYTKSVIEQCFKKHETGSYGHEDKKSSHLKKPTHHHGKNSKGNKIFYAIIGILIILLGISLLYDASPQKDVVIVKANCTENKSVAANDAILKEKMEKYNDLSNNIEIAQKKIDKQLQTISLFNESLEKKEELVKKQVKELKILNEYLKKERKEIVALLVEVINYILRS